MKLYSYFSTYMAYIHLIFRYIRFSVILLTITLASANGQEDQLRHEIQQIIKFDTDLVLDDHPGFMVTIIDQDSIYHLPFTNDMYMDGNMIHEKAIYEVGSVTKSIISLLAITLNEKGVIELNTPINEMLPMQYRNPRMSHITLDNILNHLSGLSKHPSFFGRKLKSTHNPYLYYTKKDLLKYYKNFVPETKDLSYNYSHTGYALVQYALEEVTGQQVQELLDMYVFGPLQMMDSYLVSSKEDDTMITPGFDKADRVTGAWSYGSFGTSEGIKSSSQDLAKYVKAHLINDSQLPTYRTQIITTEQSLNKYISTAYGWHVYKPGKDEYPVYTYTGKTSGHMAFIAYVKETHTAVILLSNKVIGVENLGLLILRMINYNWNRKV